MRPLGCLVARAVIASAFFAAVVQCASADSPVLTSSAGEPLFSFENHPLSDLNFGVVKRSSAYTIYRSEMLGTDGLQTVFDHTKGNGLPFPKTIVYMNVDGFSEKDDRALQELRQQSAFGYSFFHSFLYNYRTYLDGKNPLSPSEDVDSGGYLGSEAQSEIGVVVDPALDGGVDAYERILNLVLDPSRQPVLFHCLGGRHRTGMVALALRYLEGGVWLRGSHEVRVPPFFRLATLNNAQYEYYRHNTLQFRMDNLEFVETFFKRDPRGLALIERYRSRLAAP